MKLVSFLLSEFLVSRYLLSYETNLCIINPLSLEYLSSKANVFFINI